MLAYEETVLDSGNPELAYYYAALVNGREGAYYNIRLSKEEKSSIVKKLGQVVIDKGNARENFSFAMFVVGADVEKHCEAILNDESTEISYREQLVERLKEAKISHRPR